MQQGLVERTAVYSRIRTELGVLETGGIGNDDHLAHLEATERTSTSGDADRCRTRTSREPRLRRPRPPRPGARRPLSRNGPALHFEHVRPSPRGSAGWSPADPGAEPSGFSTGRRSPGHRSPRLPSTSGETTPIELRPTYRRSPTRDDRRRADSHLAGEALRESPISISKADRSTTMTSGCPG